MSPQLIPLTIFRFDIYLNKQNGNKQDLQQRVCYRSFHFHKSAEHSNFYLVQSMRSYCRPESKFLRLIAQLPFFSPYSPQALNQEILSVALG